MLHDAAATARPSDGQMVELAHSQPGLVRSPDTLIRTMAGHITAWSPGMQERYGFSSEEAHGRRSYRLLRSTFPVPVQEIEAAFMQRKTWKGGVIHRHADGRSILAVNHWYLHRNDAVDAPLVTEVHSDMTRTGDGMPCDLADVLAALAQEFAETLTALKSCVNSAAVSLQAGWPDLKNVREEIARGPAEIARGTESVRLLRELADRMRTIG